MQVSFQLKEVPEYLRSSLLFHTLLNNAESEEDVLQVPVNNFKRDVKLSTVAEVAHMIDTLHFWDSPALPKNLIVYSIDHWDRVSHLFNSKADNLKQLIKLKTVIESSVESRAITAATVGSVDILKVVHTDRNCDRICEAAAANGHVECLVYLHEHGCTWDEKISATAAGNGQLECLVYLHEHGCAWGESTCSAAAGNGHLECLVYLHEHGCAWGESTCSSAAGNGQLECLVYLHEHGCAWGESTCSAAAGNGHLECLVYLHEHGCAWGESTCSAAAGNGHLKCLVYLHEHGCAYGSTISVAAKRGQMHCVMYALRNPHINI